jgi:hypothetical protein
VLDIRRSNAVFDGAGFSIIGIGYDKAILLTGVTNARVKNFNTFISNHAVSYK